MQPDQEVIDRWSGSAPYWEKHSEIIRQMFAPVTDALVEDAQIGSEHVVLDIAMGPGEPALSVASVVGPKGKVYGVDPIPEMVEAARRTANRLGLTNAQFDVAVADQLPYSTAMFDSVISRFGVMFFPSPVEAVREMLRVLKPGRKLVLAVWHFAERNPFHHTLSQVMDQYVASPPVAPDAPDAFRFARPGKLTEVLVQAGARDVSERLFAFNIEAPIPVEDYWTLRLEISDKIRKKLAMLPSEHGKEAKHKAFDVLREYSTCQGMSFPAEVLIVSGTRSDQP